MSNTENTAFSVSHEEEELHGDEETFYSSLPPLQALPPKTENDNDNDDDDDYANDDDFFTDDGDEDPFGEDDGDSQYSNSSEMNDNDGTL